MLGIFASMILFTILFSFIFLIADPDYYVDKTAEKMGGYASFAISFRSQAYSSSNVIHHILGLVLVLG